MNATTGTGDTPLSFACENGHTDVADILLEVGAELVRIIMSFSVGAELLFVSMFIALPSL